MFPSINHVLFETASKDFARGLTVINIGLSKKSLHILLSFRTIQAVRKGALMSIDQVNTVHVCTHMFANGRVLTTRRQFKVNPMDTNNELLYRSENAFSACSCLPPVSAINTIYNVTIYISV